MSIGAVPESLTDTVTGIGFQGNEESEPGEEIMLGTALYVCLLAAL